MTSFQVFRAINEYGLVGAFRHFHIMRTFKFGTVVGVDKWGNEYFENAEEYKHGQHRWMVPAGFRSWYDFDASEIPAEWHGWLHHITDDPPTEHTVGSVYKMQPQQISVGADTPYDRNLGGVVTPHEMNPSQKRPRGYGLGNMINTKPLRSEANVEEYYTQPGWPLDKRHVQPKRDVQWSLLETADSFRGRRERELGEGTLRAIAAAKQRMLGDDSTEPTFGTVTGDAEITKPVEHDPRAALSRRDEHAIRTDMELCDEIIAQYSGYKGFPDAEKAVKMAGDRMLELSDELDEALASAAKQ